MDTRNKKILAVIFIIGILLMIVPGKSNSNSHKEFPDEESKLSDILCQIEGAGNVNVMITYYEEENYKEKSIKAKGAVIVADGADDYDVCVKLSHAAQAVLDLPAHKVRVYKSQK